MRFLLIFLIMLFPIMANAQFAARANLYPLSNNYFAVPGKTAAFTRSNLITGEPNQKETNCLRAGQWIGAISGTTMGLLHLYWRATGTSGVHGSIGENLVTAVPSMIIGAYVGSKATKWMTQQIMNGKPKPVRAALKGMAYGAIDGAIMLTASLVPLLVIGHYLGTIKFHFEGDLVLLKIIKSAVIGGVAFGGLTGAVVGTVYGPCISLYMNF